MTNKELIKLLLDKPLNRDAEKEKENNNTVIDMIYTGYSQHDCESWYKCPKCDKEYGSWGFFHKNLKGGDTFKCEKCGQTLKVPH